MLAITLVAASGQLLHLENACRTSLATMNMYLAEASAEGNAACASLARELATAYLAAESTFDCPLQTPSLAAASNCDEAVSTLEPACNRMRA